MNSKSLEVGGGLLEGGGRERERGGKWYKGVCASDAAQVL